MKKIKDFDSFLDFVKEKYDPELIVLFGSRSRGDYREDSDYDLLIVSRKFTGVPYTDRMTEFYFVWPYPYDLELITLTPEEFDEKKNKITLTAEAYREGRVL